MINIASLRGYVQGAFTWLTFFLFVIKKILCGDILKSYKYLVSYHTATH